MTPNRNQDESENPKSSTVSASKPEGEDGGWLPPTLDRLPALAAVFASWSLVVSVAYDWGFFFALGISFAHAPTTLSDHLSSWLVWATLYTPIPMAYVIYLMIRFDRQARADLKDNEGDDEVPPSVQQIFQRMRLFYRMSFWIFPVLLLSWFLFGTPKNPWGWIALSWIGLVGPWLIGLRNLPEEATARARSAVRSISLPLLLLTWVPATFFAFFAFGYSYLDRAQDDAMPRAHVRFGAGEMDSGSVVEETHVLRSFANWLLVQDQSRTQVDWVRMEQVDRIEVHPDAPFPGVLCGIFGVWCRGDSGGNPTSSLPDGTHTEAEEPTSVIGLRAAFTRTCYTSSFMTSKRTILLCIARREGPSGAAIPCRTLL